MKRQADIFLLAPHVLRQRRARAVDHRIENTHSREGSAMKLLPLAIVGVL
jgi:hypothetical protein